MRENKLEKLKQQLTSLKLKDLKISFLPERTLMQVTACHCHCHSNSSIGCIPEEPHLIISKYETVPTQSFEIPHAIK